MSSEDVERFIARWTANEGGAERANYALFLIELCGVLGVPPPHASNADTEFNDYVFERGVRRRESEAIRSTLRIDLYKKGCFILEAKQSRLPGRPKALAAQQSLPGFESGNRGRRSAAANWDVLMQNARRQAEDYVFRLDADHPAPPFIIACDVGHCLELYADFSGTGRAYHQFPDRRGFRIFLEDLRDPAIRARLAAVWTDPHALDPARVTAKVTRDIAKRLAEVSKVLEAKHPPEEVAHFLMRCIFTLFAEDVDLLPKGEFTKLLTDCIETPASFAPLLQELWQRMDEKEHERRFFSAFRRHVRHFNGNLFSGARAFPLGREEIGELIAAARHDWTLVDPAIFGTLLEQALDPKERGRLGAHYTPRAYVERLVRVTVMEPLREDWREVLLRIQSAMDAGDRAAAQEFAEAFHRRLCDTKVLDPACGTGNFLYVALEMMKVLEGEVLEKIDEIGGMKDLVAGIDPHQFLGLELNPRAAAIAELVVWIGWLQQHYRSRPEHPTEPILRAFDNINSGRKGGGHDAVVTWDGYPAPTVVVKNGERVETAPNLRRPEWPEADFIVGNPPFIGGKDLRSELGDFYAEALWRANDGMNRSADFVMYWWDRAAELLTRKDTNLRRFGFITTNSISQVFQRRVIERHLAAKKPVSILFAVADHPWTKATEKAAAVRIAMTVAVAGSCEGRLGTVVREEGIDTDTPVIEFAWAEGRINADLTVGTDLGSSRPLEANRGLSSRGVVLHGAGFLVTRNEAEFLGLGRLPGLEKHIRPYRNGRDLTANSRDFLVIDLFGMDVEDVRRRYPAVYQHVLEKLKPERDRNPREYRRKNWWLFGENVPDAREAWAGLPRYIVTVETAKHRVFQFLDAAILPDNMLVAIGSDDALHLAVLSSRVHTTWAPRLGGWLGFGNDPRYSKTRCFDPFPFPDPSASLRIRLRDLGEELDGLRKRVLAEHPDLTLTGLYNVVEKLKAGEALSDADEDVKRRGLAGVIRDLHAEIDRATAQAYGWPHDLAEEEILARLVALNAERAAEEAAGHVRWLRPDFQIPRFAKGAAAVTGELDLGPTVVAFDRDKPVFPKNRDDQSPAVRRLLLASGKPMDEGDVARAFKGPWKPRTARIAAVLASLLRYGEIERLEDGRFAARRAA